MTHAKQSSNALDDRVKRIHSRVAALIEQERASLAASALRRVSRFAVSDDLRLQTRILLAQSRLSSREIATFEDDVAQLRAEK
jgi:hypothetical protein